MKIEQFPAINPYPVLSVAKDGTVTYSNEAGKLLLYDWGMKVGERLPSYIVDFMQRVISLNSPEKMEVEVGKRIYLVVFHPLPEQECVNISGFDISDQKGLEEKVKERTAELEEAYISLKESKERLAETQKIAHVGNWEWNIVTNKLFWTDEVYRIFGLKPQEFDPTHNAFLNYVHPKDREYVNDAIREALNRKPYDIDYRTILADGEERVIHAQGEAIFDEKNAPVRMRGIVQDITERKKAEKTLANYEANRKKEIHHRINTNLQIISSLLDLQADKFIGKKNVKDSEVIQAFWESKDRVLSMALIHEELHKGGDKDKIDFSEYIGDLADNLFLTHRLGNTGIRLETDLDENIFFETDTAIPLGLIINELISNSLKYAFSDRENGEIRIKLHRDETIKCKVKNCNNTSYVLSVSDNGVGIHEDLDIRILENLGLQLVTSLVEQLDGELELKRDNGTEFIIRFTIRK